MKTLLKAVLWTLAVSTSVIVLAVIGFVVWAGTSKQSVPGPEAMQALADIHKNAAVEVSDDEWFVISPTGVEARAGLIIYPGAHSAVRGYVKVMTRLAEAGYLVVATRMPLGYAFLAPNRAKDVFEAYPTIEHWFLAGHSLGGAMAGRYAALHGDRLAGLAFWDAYPPEANSLADSQVPTMLLYRATLDGEPEQKFNEKKHLFPSSTDWVPIRGGDHGQFGDNVGGMFKEFGMFIRGMDEKEWEATQWKASISRDEQQSIIADAMLNWFRRVLDRQVNL